MLTFTKPKHFPGKILIIDDDYDIRSIYNEFLTNEGFLVDVAANGQEGLAKILIGGYDLILLDIMMPKIDGLGILRFLKNHVSDSKIYNGPIIILSALDQQYVINEAMALGAKGYLIKANLTPDESLKKIVKFLENPL